MSLFLRIILIHDEIYVELTSKFIGKTEERKNEIWK